MIEKKYIPINKVKSRMENLNLFLMKKDPSLQFYPLNEDYKTTYDFQNIKSSIKNWNYFSESVVTNINKVCELLKIINLHGDNNQLQEVTDLINTNIIPYLKNPTEFKYNFSKLNESIPDYVKQIIDKICEQAECDRVIYNKDLISKRFNIDKMFSYILGENSRSEIIYNFCNLIDTYNMPLKSKYCIANELALLYSSKYFENLPIQLIEEDIIDYFIMQHGTNDLTVFIDTLQEAINKDRFISEYATDYLKYIEGIYHSLDETDYEQEILDHFNENVGISFVLGYSTNSNNLKKSYKNVLTEMKLFNKTQNLTRDLFTKIKIAPVKTVTMTKNLLASVFDNISEDDVINAVKTIWEYTFKILVTFKTFTLGLITVVTAYVGNLIYEKYFSDEARLRRAIEVTKEHKEEVDRKISIEIYLTKKERLQEYSRSLQEEIEKLELEYEQLIAHKKEVEEAEKLKRTTVGYDVERNVP